MDLFTNPHTYTTVCINCIGWTVMMSYTQVLPIYHTHMHTDTQSSLTAMRMMMIMGLPDLDIRAG